MTNAVNQTANFEPIHAAHAIEQVAFVVQFDRPFNDAIFSEIREISKRFEADLPGKMEIQSMSFAIGAQPVLQSPQQHAPTGLILRRTAPDGSVEAELRIEQRSLTFLTTRYTRWDEIWSQATVYFNVLLPLYITQAGARLLAVSLNYIDKFAWNGNLANCTPNSLLRPESKYICKHIFETKDFWHSHTGSFIRVNNFTKRLLNINVDYIDELVRDGTRRVIGITTVLTDQFNQAGYDEYVADQDASIAMINNRMQDMHIFGKSVLTDLITYQMCQRIALVE